MIFMYGNSIQTRQTYSVFFVLRRQKNLSLYKFYNIWMHKEILKLNEFTYLSSTLLKVVHILYDFLHWSWMSSNYNKKVTWGECFLCLGEKYSDPPSGQGKMDYFYFFILTLSNTVIQVLRGYVHSFKTPWQVLDMIR